LSDRNLDQTERSRSQRSDARRNRERILAAAKDAFAAGGAATSMAEIARRASIGSATLYRNFPDRRALLEALYSEEVDAITTAAEAPGATDLARLQDWLRRFAEYFTGKQALAGELLKDASPNSAVFGDGYTRIAAAGEQLVVAAHRSGQLRPDLDLQQLFALVGAITGLRASPEFTTLLLEQALALLATPIGDAAPPN